MSRISANNQPVRTSLNPLVGRRAFSLMEVMLAVTILGMISTLIYASFARSLEVPSYLRDLQERYHRVRIAMERMTREISMAYLSKHVNPNQDDAPQYIFRVKKGDRGSRIDFTAFAHLKMYEEAKESDQGEFGYFLEADPEMRGQWNLMRRAQNRIDHEPGWGGVKRVLTPDVVDFRVKVWNELDKEWAEEWDTSQIEQFEQMPWVVSLELTILDENEKEITFYTKAQIMLRAPVNLVSL